MRSGGKGKQRLSWVLLLGMEGVFAESDPSRSRYKTEADLLSFEHPKTNNGGPLTDQRLQAIAHKMALSVLEQTTLDELDPVQPEAIARSLETTNDIHALAHATAVIVEDSYLKGRYNRSRARAPENIDAWRSKPDVANPGADLANFPNSAFTLPQGRAYVEMSPLTYYGPGLGQPAQFNTEFLLRYGLTDDIEARVFGNGVSWQGGEKSTTGFSPIAFDTKIHLMNEREDWHLPAIGFEAYLQTTWLGNEAFSQGTTPGFFLNLDQSLPFEIDFEYNLGAAEQPDGSGKNVWQFSFQWAFQRDLFNQDLAVFIHGFVNSMTLPRLPGQTPLAAQPGSSMQNAVGGGVIYTPNNRVSLWVQSAGGTTADSPSVISNMGFAVAF